MTEKRAAEIAVLYLIADKNNFSINKNIIDRKISEGEEICLTFLLDIINQYLPNKGLLSELKDKLKIEENSISYLSKEMNIENSEFEDFIMYLYLN